MRKSKVGHVTVSGAATIDSWHVPSALDNTCALPRGSKAADWILKYTEPCLWPNCLLSLTTQHYGNLKCSNGKWVFFQPAEAITESQSNPIKFNLRLVTSFSGDVSVKIRNVIAASRRQNCWIFLSVKMSFFLWSAMNVVCWHRWSIKTLLAVEHGLWVESKFNLDLKFWLLLFRDSCV